jgi:hypothetical protein
MSAYRDPNSSPTTRTGAGSSSLRAAGARRARLIGLVGGARLRTGDAHRADRIRAVREWGRELWEIEQLRRRCVRAALERDRLDRAPRRDA